MLALALDKLEPSCLEEVALKKLHECHCGCHFRYRGKEVVHRVGQEEEEEVFVHCFVVQMKPLCQQDPSQCQHHDLVPAACWTQRTFAFFIKN